MPFHQHTNLHHVNSRNINNSSKSLFPMTTKGICIIRYTNSTAGCNNNSISSADTGREDHQPKRREHTLADRADC